MSIRACRTGFDEVGPTDPGWVVGLNLALSVALLLGAIFGRHDIILQILWPVQSALCAGRAYQSGRRRVGVDQGGVWRTDRLLRRHRVPWDEVDHFEIQAGQRELGLWDQNRVWVRLLRFSRGGAGPVQRTLGALERAQTRHRRADTPGATTR